VTYHRGSIADLFMNGTIHIYGIEDIPGSPCVMANGETRLRRRAAFLSLSSAEFERMSDEAISRLLDAEVEAGRFAVEDDSGKFPHVFARNTAKP
jgi:hypothetical protein